MDVSHQLLVLLMAKCQKFASSQQLIVPGIFLLCFALWQFATGSFQWHSLQDACRSLVPYLATAAILWAWQVVAAASDLKRDFENPQTELQFRVLTASGSPVRHRTPIFGIVATSVVFMIPVFAIVVLSAFEAFLSVQTLPSLIVIAPNNDLGAPKTSVAADDKHPSLVPPIPAAMQGFRLSIMGVATSRSDGGQTLLMLLTTLSNSGPPSTANDWRVQVIERGEKPKTMYPFFVNQNGGSLNIHTWDGHVARYNIADMLYFKNATVPLIQGATATGLLAFFLEGMTQEEAETSGILYRISCADVYGHRASVDYYMVGGKHIPYQGVMPYAPGMDQPKSQ